MDNLFFTDFNMISKKVNFLNQIHRIFSKSLYEIPILISEGSSSWDFQKSYLSVSFEDSI